MTETAPVAPPPVKEEPEKIRKWREEQKARLEEKGMEIDGIVKTQCHPIGIVHDAILLCSTLCTNCFRRRGGKEEGRVERSGKERIRRMVQASRGSH